MPALAASVAEYAPSQLAACCSRHDLARNCRSIRAIFVKAKARPDEPVDTIADRMPAHAQRRHQLFDIEAVLIAHEGQDHEVANFNMILLE